MATVTMHFLSMEEFKDKLGVSTVNILKSKTTNKLFASIGGKSFKVQQTITSSKPIKFIYNDVEGFDNGCITNVDSAPTVMTL